LIILHKHRSKCEGTQSTGTYDFKTMTTKKDASYRKGSVIYIYGSSWIRIHMKYLNRDGILGHKFDKRLESFTPCYSPVFRIRTGIHFLRIRIRIQRLRLETNTDPEAGDQYGSGSGSNPDPGL
jgi:hypothetical protein